MIKTIIRIVRNAVAAAFKAMKRAALFAAGTVGGMVDALFASEASLPEPEYEEVFAPGEAWMEETAALHMQHEIQEREGRLATNPNSALYRYVCAPRDKRDELDISGVSPDAQAWARRLTDAEALLVRKAGCEGMLRHISGKKAIPAVAQVRKVQQVLDFTQRVTTGEYDLSAIPELPPSYRLAM